MAYRKKPFLKGFNHISVLIFYVMLKFLPNYSNASVFSYIPKMENLLVIQKHVIQSAKTHLPNLGDTEKRIIQGYIFRWQREHRKAMNNTTRYLENPINAYTLVRRLVTDLKYIEDILIWDRFKEYKRKRKLQYPSEQALKAANAAILHLMFVYNLNIAELANGTLVANVSKSNKPFIEFVSPMTASDCYELARGALEYNEHDMALVWGKEAFHRYPEDCKDSCYFTEWDTVQFVSQVYADRGEFQKGLFWLEKNKPEGLTTSQSKEYEWKIRLLRTQKEIKNYTSNKEKELRFIKKQILRTRWIGKPNALCFTGRLNQNNLTCHYKLGPNPFLRLARLKAETLHLKPEITLFYDVISDDENSALQKMAEERDDIHSINDETSAPDTIPSQPNCEGHYAIYQLMRQVACFAPGEGWPLATISRRALDISGFTDALVKPSAIFVSNYGVAGYHNPHTDDNKKSYVSNIRVAATKFIQYL